jgi:hypothetical protein
MEWLGFLSVVGSYRGTQWEIYPPEAVESVDWYGRWHNGEEHQAHERVNGRRVEGGQWERQRMAVGKEWKSPRGVCFGSVEKDLAWLFSPHPHTPLNSTISLYSRNIKENFIETPMNSFKDPSFGLTWI